MAMHAKGLKEIYWRLVPAHHIFRIKWIKKEHQNELHDYVWWWLDLW